MKIVYINNEFEYIKFTHSYMLFTCDFIKWHIEYIDKNLNLLYVFQVVGRIIKNFKQLNTT
jgi:hypothetical protein